MSILENFPRFFGVTIFSVVFFVSFIRLEASWSFLSSRFGLSKFKLTHKLVINGELVHILPVEVFSASVFSCCQQCRV